MFEGEEPALSESDLRLLDRLDTAASRETGDGIWGSDSYGIVHAGALDGDAPRAVCTYHPQLPVAGYGGLTGFDDGVRDRIDDALWNYCERVVALVQDDLDEFYRTGGDGES